MRIQNRTRFALAGLATAAGAAVVSIAAAADPQTSSVAALDRAREAVMAVRLAAVSSELANGNPEAKIIASRGVAERSQLTFRQLGARDALAFRRTGESIGIPFSTRVDEVVTAARLRLAYQYDPRIARENAYVRVALNGETIASLPLPRERAGAPATQEIAIDPRLFADFNRVTVQIDSALAECVEPGRGEPLLRVMNTSALELQSLRIALTEDLALLPLPFFDSRDPRRLDLPFVLGEKPAAAVLEAASIVSSWFGAQAGYRGAQFGAVIGRLPKGNAVVFATPGERPVGVALPAIEGPTLAILANPEDDQGRLLLVAGRDAAELKVAAAGLAASDARLSGRVATVGGAPKSATLAPYRTANWVPTDRPVRLGELVDARNLVVTGEGAEIEPVRVNLRIPPDVFAWRSAGVPIDLRYRYSPKRTNDGSVLNVNVNGTFVRALPMRGEIPRSSWRGFFGIEERTREERALPDGTVQGYRRVMVDPRTVASQSHFNIEYDFDYAGRAACGQSPGASVGGGIDPDSTIDLSGFRHYLPMPNLAAFGNAGFPFTRVADLSETAVVLPDAPGASDLAALLTVMGRMGESTGTAVTGVQVVAAAAIGSVADKDLLVIGGPGNQPLFKQWSQRMSWDVTEERAAAGTARAWSNAIAWLRSKGGTVRGEPATGHAERQPGDGAIIGFESPLKAGRSVVAVVADSKGEFAGVTTALVDADLLSRIQGSAVSVGPGRVETLSSDTNYYSGALPPFTWLQWYFSNHPVRLLFALLAIALFVALVLRARFAAIAADRQRAG